MRESQKPNTSPSGSPNTPPDTSPGTPHDTPSNTPPNIPPNTLEGWSRREMIDHAMALSARRGAYLFRSRRREDREDALQEAVMMILERVDRFDPTRSPARTFLRVMVRDIWREIIARGRLKKNQPARALESLTEEEQPTARETAERVDLRLDLARLREKLTAEQQEIFDLLGDHSQTEIARLLRLSPATISRRVEEIREKLSAYVSILF